MAVNTFKGEMRDVVLEQQGAEAEFGVKWSVMHSLKGLYGAITHKVREPVSTIPKTPKTIPKSHRTF